MINVILSDREYQSTPPRLDQIRLHTAKRNASPRRNTISDATPQRTYESRLFHTRPGPIFLPAAWDRRRRTRSCPRVRGELKGEEGSVRVCLIILHIFIIIFERGAYWWCGDADVALLTALGYRSPLRCPPRRRKN
jgi:hypothetical protein